MIKKLTARRTFLLISILFPFFNAVWLLYTCLYRVSAGLTPFQLVLAGTALELSVFLAEVPTGIVADMVSRRRSVIIGYLIMGLGFFIEGAFTLPWVIISAQAVWGLGYTFISGAQEAWLADEIGSENLADIFLLGARFGWIASITGTCVAAAIGLGFLSIRLPIMIGGIGVVGLGIILFFLMPETGFRPADPEERNTWQQMWFTFQAGGQIVRQSRILLIIFGITLFIGFSSEGLDRLWEAYLFNNFTFPDLFGFNAAFSDRFARFGSDLPNGFGPEVAFWFFLLSLSTKLLAFWVTGIVRRSRLAEDDARSVRYLIFVDASMMLGILLFITTLQLPLAIVAIYMIFLPRATVHPIRAAWINRQIDGPQRATVLSMRGQMDAVGQITSGPLMGLIATVGSIRIALLGVVLLLSPTLWFYRQALRLSGDQSEIEREVGG